MNTCCSWTGACCVTILFIPKVVKKFKKNLKSKMTSYNKLMIIKVEVHVMVNTLVGLSNRMNLFNPI